MFILGGSISFLWEKYSHTNKHAKYSPIYSLFSKIVILKPGNKYADLKILNMDGFFTLKRYTDFFIVWFLTIIILKKQFKVLKF